MILDELPGDPPIRLHPRVTLLATAAIEPALERVRAAIAAAAGSEAVPDVVLRAAALPGAVVTEVDAVDGEPAPGPVDDGENRLEAAEAALALAVADEGAARAALEALAADPALVVEDDGADDAALEEAQREVEAARAALEEALQAVADERAAGAAATSAADSDRQERLEELRERREDLERRRAEVAPALEGPPPVDPMPVYQALERCRREVAKVGDPVAEARDLADRLADARRRLAQLGSDEPPAWLVEPAEEAFASARAALEAAEAAGTAPPVEAAQAERVERAHDRVLEAEQRHMEKPGYLARRRLDAAMEAERSALARLDVASYNDYLQLQASQDPDVVAQRVAKARAELADAEAVWEELHTPQPNPERDALLAEISDLRSQGVEMLGAQVGDEELEASLRGLTTDGGDVAGAREELLAALREAGAPAEGDPVYVANAFVAEAGAAFRARRDAQAGMDAVTRELQWVERHITELEAELEGELPAEEAESDGLGELRARLAGAEAALERAQADAVEARRQLVAAREREESRAAAEERLSEALAARDAAAEALATLEEELTTPPAPPTARVRTVVDLSAATAIEAEVYVLARLAAQRTGAEGESLPLVVDGSIAGLSPDGRHRVLALLARMSPVVQVVVVGDDAVLESWVDELGADVAALERTA